MICYHINGVVKTLDNKMTTKNSQFPIVDAFLLTPQEGARGCIGICTNTFSPGYILNEIDEANRKKVSVLGPLIVNRDGTERMILNCLAHPTLTYLILFSEESHTFCPSTNLLLSIQKGVDYNTSAHGVIDGKGASAQYPNLSKRIIESFNENIIVLPLFMFSNNYSAEIISAYIEWLKPKVPIDIYGVLKEVNSKKKIYYDSLNKLILMLSTFPVERKKTTTLDPKEFQHLQPPKIKIKEKNIKQNVPFHVRKEKYSIRVDINIGDKTYFIRSSDEFLMEYSLMKFLGERKKNFKPIEQLLLGAEISRINIELKNGIIHEPFINKLEIRGNTEIKLYSNIKLVTDKKYYYKINIKEKKIAVMCLAFDVCEQIFELRSTGIGGVFSWIAEKNRFEEYEMDILHRIDIGGQIARAVVAAENNYLFIQDFPNIFKINTERMPLLIVEGDSFLDVHKKALMKLYTEGLTEEHGDKQKGMARSGVVLAIYRDTKKSFKTLPAIYKQGDQTTVEIRTAYKKQLLRFDHDGDYSYGERTRKFFGFDQLLNSIKILRDDSGRATLIQRFDPSKDMGSILDETTGKITYTHDPCLTHDIFFIIDNTLHSFHIARAHNMVNAYPENVMGLFDAYVSMVCDTLNLEHGDMYMLSSRANILLLTEEQRVKKLLEEPSKPVADFMARSGPNLLGKNVKISKDIGGVAYEFLPLKKVSKKPTSKIAHKILSRLENFEGIDILDKAIAYLKQKGVMHNNPILSEYQAGKMDPQGDYLAFFQVNVFGNKLHTTAVFMNHSINSKREDIEVLNYLTTRYGDELGYPLGELSLFYVGYKK